MSDRSRHWPAPWVFAVLSLPMGVFSGVGSVPLPYLLAKSGVSVDEIGRISSIMQLPTVFYFLWAPLVDIKLRRRTWLVLAALVSAICLCVAMPFIGPRHLHLLTALIFAGFAASMMVSATLGGLMVTTLSYAGQAKASAWHQAGNLGAGTLGGAATMWLAGHYSIQMVGMAAAVMTVVPAFVALTIPEPPPKPAAWFGSRLAEIGKEIAGVFRSRDRLWSVILLAAPIGAGAAQGLLPAIASHYGVGGSGVMWINGVAGGLVLALGSLCGVLVPGDWDRRLTYAGAGLTNAFAAMVLLAVSHPSVYLVGTVLYLLTLGFCFARFTALVVEVLGASEKGASTRYSLFVSIGNAPIAYMLWFDSIGYKHWGTHGLLWTDAGGNLLMFALVAVVFVVYGLTLRRPAADLRADAPVTDSRDSN
jgi:MFS transporter, PAT family, beta-lactamase induction signal transducer AmpG